MDSCTIVPLYKRTSVCMHKMYMCRHKCIRVENMWICELQRCMDVCSLSPAHPSRNNVLHPSVLYSSRQALSMETYANFFLHIDPLAPHKPWIQSECATSSGAVRISAVFVLSDPVDWSRDLQVWILINEGGVSIHVKGHVNVYRWGVKSVCVCKSTYACMLVCIDACMHVCLKHKSTTHLRTCVRVFCLWVLQYFYVCSRNEH